MFIFVGTINGCGVASGRINRRYICVGVYICVCDFEAEAVDSVRCGVCDAIILPLFACCEKY